MQRKLILSERKRIHAEKHRGVCVEETKKVFMSKGSGL